MVKTAPCRVVRVKSKSPGNARAVAAFARTGPSLELRVRVVAVRGNDVAALTAARVAFARVAANSDRYARDVEFVVESAHAYECLVARQRPWDRTRFWATHATNVALIRSVWTAYETAMDTGHRFTFTNDQPS